MINRAMNLDEMTPDHRSDADKNYPAASSDPPASASPSSSRPFEILRDEVADPAGPKPDEEPTPPPPPPPPPEAEPPPSPRMGLFWKCLPLILAVAGFAAVVLTQRGVGYSWDEAYYYEPSLNAADWLIEVLRGERPVSREAIDQYWSLNREHPGVMKFLAGVSLRLFEDPRDHLFAMRLPQAIMFGLTAALIFMIGRIAFGGMPALAAAIIYATLPRVFGHAHFASLETTLLFMMVLVVYCFLRGLDSPAWAALTGVSFGLLLATKINAFFLPIPLVLWGHLYARRSYVNNLFAMLVLGPLVFVAAWPWLWHDTATRVLEYLYFHAEHQLTALYYLGRTWGYGQANAPWHYPAVMILVTTPLLALALILAGLASTALAPRRRRPAVLFALCALVMLGVASAPGTPRYDGVRLFLPAFPFLALLGGAGFAWAIERIGPAAARARSLDPAGAARFVRRAALVIILLLLLEGGLAIGRYHPFMLSYFNPIVGGLAGARDRFETTYWGEALNQDVIDQLNTLPDGSRIKPLALHQLNFDHLQQWGLLKDTLQFGGPPPYDFHILQFRRGFFGRPERALADHDRFRPHFLPVRKFGVPLLAVYRTGIEFERFWPRVEAVD